MSIKILFLKFLPSPLLPSQLSPLERAERGGGGGGGGNLQLRWHDISGCTLSERSERGRDILNKFFQRRLTTANERRKPWIRESGVRKKMELIVQLFSPVDFFFFSFYYMGWRTFQLFNFPFQNFPPFPLFLANNIVSIIYWKIFYPEWILEYEFARITQQCEFVSGFLKKKKKKNRRLYIFISNIDPMRRNLFFLLVESFFIKSCHNKGAPRVNRDIKLTNGGTGRG